MARDAYAAPSNGLIEIEDDARVVTYGAGAIVQAWVWISDPDDPDAENRNKDTRQLMAKF
jgi:hypothetical protein